MIKSENFEDYMREPVLQEFLVNLCLDKNVDPVSVALLKIKNSDKLRKEVASVGAYTDLDRLFFVNVQPSNVRLYF